MSSCRPEIGLTAWQDVTPTSRPQNEYHKHILCRRRSSLVCSRRTQQYYLACL